ncbi:MAG: response regulator transcription factor [Abditibacteriales bacterium]|nr:response regulator transcription factor [Abditibacteriales bacterium]MDW8364483.1 response regulator transcription factor [Abditibacteriales bacterium]
MITVALVSLDRNFALGLRAHLVGWGYQAWIADPAEPVVEQLRERGAELVLLDFGATPNDPVYLCRQIKREDELDHIPLIAIVSSHEAPRLDFSTGIEDFLIKGAAPAEIEARLKLLFWRLNKVDAEDTLRAGDLVVNLASYQVTLAGKPIDLTYKEFELLRFLMTHPGRVWTREALLRHVWGEEYFGGTRTVDVHIRRLRAKIGAQLDEMIQTVRNVGYRFTK